MAWLGGKIFLGLVVFSAVGGGAFLFLKDRQVVLDTLSPSNALIVPRTDGDSPAQKPLTPVPSTVNGIYLTSWSAGSEKKINEILDLIQGTKINAVVIDLKDFSGTVAYNTDVDEVIRYNARELRISKLNTLIKKLHDHGIYVIGRVTIFQDPILAKARPELAVHSKKQISSRQGQLSAATLWKDRKGLSWIDASSKDAWDYNISIAQDALSRGIDEINFDYIRFPSDGNIDDMYFPASQNTPKPEVLRKFFSYLRDSLPGSRISADIFGMTLVAADDMGIGQIVEDAYRYFDVVAPMIYPSHFSSGFNGYKNPASQPYGVIKYSMDAAVKRLLPPAASGTSSPTLNPSFTAKLRPWLQAFDLGARYDAGAIRDQIKATQEAAESAPHVLDGYLLWDPANRYKRDSLL